MALPARSVAAPRPCPQVRPASGRHDAPSVSEEYPVGGPRCTVIHMIKRIAFALFIIGSTAGVAAAQQTQSSAAAPAGAAAEVKAAKGIEKREPVEEGTTFAAGDKVWIWSRITGANGTKVQHVWKRNGAPEWKATLAVNSKRWTTSSRRKVKAGSYTVDVVAADGSVLGSVAFTVQ